VNNVTVISNVISLT